MEIKKITYSFFKGLFKHNLTTLAAALSFYIVLSLSPLLLLIVMAAGFINSNIETRLIEESQNIMGSDASKIIEMIIRNSSHTQHVLNLAGIFGFVALLFSASAMFSQLQSSLNEIAESETISQDTGWRVYLRNKIFAMGMVIVFEFIALASLTTNTVVDIFFTTQNAAWRMLNEIFTILVFAGIFALIFKYFISLKIAWKNVLWGGIFTSILFTIGKLLLGIYLRKIVFNSAYDAAGSLILFLVWVYYSSIIVFVGATFTRSICDIDIKQD